MKTRLGQTRLIIVSFACAALLASALGGAVAGADRPGECPAKLGPLSFSSGEINDPGERHPKARCFYRSDDWDKQATIRASWIPADQPDAGLNLESTYCLSEDEEQVGDGQYGEATRVGRVFPTVGEQMVLGTYLATRKGASTAKIMKAARALAASMAPLAAACPTPPEAPVVEATAAPTAETFSDDEIYAGILDIAGELASATPSAFDREAVGACIGADPESMSVGLIEGSRHAHMISNACAVFPLLLDDLPAEQASEVMVLIITVLAADEERRQAEAAATE
jgi:hypothetical protein